MGKKEKAKSVLEELEQLAPILARLKEEAPAPPEVPARYFETLPADVLRRIQAGEVAPPPNWFDGLRNWPQAALSSLFRPAYAVALVVVIGLLIAVVALMSPEPSLSSTELVLTDQEINDYIDAHLDDFDLILLAEEVSADPLETAIYPEEDNLDEDLPEYYFDDLLDDLELDDLL